MKLNEEIWITFFCDSKHPLASWCLTEKYALEHYKWLKYNRFNDLILSPIQFMPWDIGKRPLWILFDLCNGDPFKDEDPYGYLWWFGSRREAREFLAEHKTHDNYVKLSSVQKWYVR